jgi:hypothetical protein
MNLLIPQLEQAWRFYATHDSGLKDANTAPRVGVKYIDAVLCEVRVCLAACE